MSYALSGDWNTSSGSKGPGVGRACRLRGEGEYMGESLARAGSGWLGGVRWKRGEEARHGDILESRFGRLKETYSEFGESSMVGGGTKESEDRRGGDGWARGVPTGRVDGGRAASSGRTRRRRDGRREDKGRGTRRRGRGGQVYHPLSLCWPPRVRTQCQHHHVAAPHLRPNFLGASAFRMRLGSGRVTES